MTSNRPTSCGMTGYWSPSRPYVEGQRFTGAGHYWRPDLHLRAWYWAPDPVKRAVRYSAVATFTVLLAGLRVWQAINQPSDETGD